MGQQTATAEKGPDVSWLASVGHTTSPAQQGQRVAVVGDGWGSGTGGYEAMVTEADRLTFTVVAVNDSKWQEMHVLQEHCIPLAEKAFAPVAAQMLSARTSKVRRLSG